MQAVEDYKEEIRGKYDKEADPYFATSRIWDDGIIEPRETRSTLALALAVAANAPVPHTDHGIFRM